MGDYIEPSVHIDTKVVETLIETRINEGVELIATGNASNEWKKTEKLFLSKMRQALDIIRQAIEIKEGKSNESTENKNSTETHKNNWQAGSQNQKA